MKERQGKNMNSKLAKEREGRVLAGRVDGLPSVSSRTVRVFISSTFSDMIVERNVLMERVYPKLKDFCKHYGLEFQVVDMRWGVREEAQDDHMTSCLCMKEIHKCRRISVGPTFVVMFGQKYGYRPFPARIGAEEFEMLNGALLQAGRDVSLLQQWYRKDENCLPPEYSLLPISSKLPDYVNSANPELQNQARDAWWKTFQSLQSLLRTAADICYKDGEMKIEDLEKYFISVTEDEIQHGTVKDPIRDRQVVFKRHIADLQENLDNSRAAKFIDLKPDGKTIDAEAQELLFRFRDRIIPEYVSENNTRSYSLRWSDDGGVSTRDHPEYLHRLCEDFYEMIKRQIISNLAQRDDLHLDPLVNEVLQHAHLCVTRCHSFQGRNDILQKMQQYILHDSEAGGEPFVVHGESGSGKTSLMAVAVSQMVSWLSNDCDPVIILRFLGTTPKSTGIFTVLQSICQQISRNYDIEYEEVAEDFQQLTSKFWDLLKAGTKERPLILLLDSLDQLSQNHQPFRLTWLPCELPPNVKLIVSTLPLEHGTLGRLKDWIHEESNFVEVPHLGNRLSMDLIKLWLKNSSQTLTAYQFTIVRRALKSCSLPLYTKLVFEEVARWKSYTPEDKIVLELTVKGIINQMFSRIEIQHGRLLVSHALAYLTASRNGLSEVELEDMLSLDDEVLDEIFTFWVPPVRRIPPLLWTRVRDDICNYLVEQEADGVTVLSWYHRQFHQVMRDRYLKDHHDLLWAHSALADYYMGRWSRGRKKPFRYSAIITKRFKMVTSDSAADRKITTQPLKWKTKTPQGGVKVAYNLRKLSELPYHLYMSERHAELLRQIFYNYKWLHTKLKATSLAELLSDLAMVHKANKGHRLEMLAAALRVAGASLRQIPNTLAVEIIGRLKNAPQNNKAVDVRDIEEFLSQVHKEGLKHCSLLPTFQCFDVPIEALAFSLEGHRKLVTDIVFSQDSLNLYSVSMDGTVVSWDTKTGESMWTANAEFARPGRHANLHCGAQIIVLETYAEGSPLCVFDEKTGALIHTASERQPGYIHNTIVEGDTAVREGVVVNLAEGTVVNVVDYITKCKTYATVTMTNNKKYLLVGESSRSTVMINVETGKPVAAFPSENIASCIVVTKNDSRAVIGYCSSCLIQVIHIDPTQSNFGQVDLTFDYQATYRHKKFAYGMMYSQEVSQIALSHDNRFAVLNMKRVSLFVVGLECTRSSMMDMEVFENGSCHVHKCGFGPDNITVIAAVNNYLCLWNAHVGSLLARLQVVSSPDAQLDMAIAPTNSLVATVNKQDNVIKIWDVRKLQEPQSPNVHVYSNPLDVVVVAPRKKLAFIKVYHALSSRKGYHYLDYFGIDVWNLATNHHQSFLAFGNYGQLVHMEMSVDGRLLLLLTEVRSVGHVFVVDIEQRQIVSQSKHTLCYRVHLSPDSQYMLMESRLGKDGAEIMVWKTASGEYVHAFDKSKAAIFTSDSTYVVCLNGKNITKYCLNRKSLVTVRLAYLVPERLQTIPNRPDTVIVTGVVCSNLGKRQSEVHLWNLKSEKTEYKLEGVAPQGILDFSKNGKFAVDAWVQVYDLQSGELVKQCVRLDPTVTSGGEKSLVRLTHDGGFVLWVDCQPTDCIKAFNLKANSLVAEVSTHSPVLTLNLIDFGYSVVAGCKDGHLLTFQLHYSSNVDEEDDDDEEDFMDGSEGNGCGNGNRLVVPFDKNQSKSNCSLDRIDRISRVEMPLTVEEVDMLDPAYGATAIVVLNEDLPVVGDEVKEALEASARFSRDTTLPRAKVKGVQKKPSRKSKACCLL